MLTSTPLLRFASLLLVAGLAGALTTCGAEAGPETTPDEDASAITDAAAGAGAGAVTVTVVACPTLADLAGGYKGSASLDFGDSPGTCDWIDCDFGYGSWSGQLYVGSNGLFRMSQDFGAAWSGGSASATLHLDGIARMDGCGTLVVDHLYDYHAAGAADLACDFTDYREVTSSRDEIRLGLTLVSSGALEVRDVSDALGFGDRVYRVDSSVGSTTAHDNDGDFTSAYCDPVTGPCPRPNLGDPCTVDGDCWGGTCNGVFCTKSCTDEGDNVQCAGPCKYGENHVGKYNYCAAGPDGDLGCLPECPFEDGRSLCSEIYPGSACLRIDAVELCRTECDPGTAYCDDGDRLVTCGAAGTPELHECDAVCQGLGYVGSKGCNYWPGGAECDCVPAPCDTPWERECLDDDTVRVCEDGYWLTYSCADDCKNDGYGEPKGCWVSNSVEDCWCHAAPCEEDGLRDCIHDNLIRVCVDGLWAHMTCEQDCAQSGFGAPLYCGYRPEIGMDDCICETL